MVEVNTTLADHLGYTPQEMVGRCLEITAPESREEIIRRMQTDDPGPYEAISLHRDDSCTIGAIRARGVTYMGRPMRVVAIRDITERRLAEMALQASEARLRAAIDSIADEVWFTDADGNILLVTTWPSRIWASGHATPSSKVSKRP